MMIGTDEPKQSCRACGEPIYSPDYGGDLDDYHVSDKTEAWPYCDRVGGKHQHLLLAQ